MKRIVIGCLLLVGCNTAYQQKPRTFVGSMFRSTGYSEQKIDDDMYIVSFVSNARSSAQANLRRTMYRSAELCLANEYRYFKVLSTHASKKVEGSAELPVTNLTIRCYEQRPDDAAISATKYISLNPILEIKDRD